MIRSRIPGPLRAPCRPARVTGDTATKRAMVDADGAGRSPARQRALPELDELRLRRRRTVRIHKRMSTPLHRTVPRDGEDAYRARHEDATNAARAWTGDAERLHCRRARLQPRSIVIELGVTREHCDRGRGVAADIEGVEEEAVRGGQRVEQRPAARSRSVVAVETAGCWRRLHPHRAHEAFGHGVGHLRGTTTSRKAVS